MCELHALAHILWHVPNPLILAPLLQDGPRPRHLVPERPPPELGRPRKPPRPTRHDKAREARLLCRRRAQRPRPRERRREDRGREERARVVVQALVPEQVGRCAQEGPQKVVVRFRAACRRRGEDRRGSGRRGCDGRGGTCRRRRGRGGRCVRRRWRWWRRWRWRTRRWRRRSWRWWRRRWWPRARAIGRRRLAQLRAREVERLLLVHRRRVHCDRLHACAHADDDGDVFSLRHLAHERDEAKHAPPLLDVARPARHVVAPEAEDVEQDRVDVVRERAQDVLALGGRRAADRVARVLELAAVVAALRGELAQALLWPVPSPLCLPVDPRYRRRT
ncbi:hypothetical protein DMC30DRAFT_391848 [Rhodotorula diobovata]|uniref:Uncharacterized protein n=1 Tax=Rhodotorula diobovata TaxID=5288 RepID=A0A5C5G2D4_9BASI|nr:hypothetical protein DMC30DRAFT_391848 [Rhodotorula diobovata]